MKQRIKGVPNGGGKADRSAFLSRIPDITGVILAGGESRRMKSDKSLLPLGGARFIDHVYRVVDELFEEVLIVTNSPNGYADIPCRKVTDLHVNRGVLAGIHSGLCHSRHARVFVVACDMPFINPLVVRAICTSSVAADVVIPSQTVGLEPLHAIYAKSCIKAITDQLDAGEKRITSFFLKVCVRELGSEYWQGVDPQGLSFCNINTPNEYFRLRCEAEDQKFVQEGQQACSGDRLP